MNRFFEIAIIITIALTFVNGLLFAFSASLLGETIQLGDIKITDQNVSSIAETESFAKSGDPLSQLWSYISNLVGSLPVLGEAQQALGGIGLTLTILFNFSQGYSTVLEAIFGTMGPLWVFIQWTIIPALNLLQVMAITWLLLYVVSALRGGGA